MLILFYTLVGLALLLSWIFYGWQLVIIIVIIYISLGIYWFISIQSKIKYRFEKGLEAGHSLNKIKENIENNF